MPSFPPRRVRPGPLALAAIAVLALLMIWAVGELWLHLLGIAASPLSWLLSLLGAIASAIATRGG